MEGKNAQPRGEFGTPFHELNHMDWEIIGLSETHWCDAGELCRDSIQILCCGNESIHREGVAILLNKSAQRSLIGYNPISAGIISARLRTQIGATTIVQVYAPTSASCEEEIDSSMISYNKLSSRHHPKIS